MPTSDVLFAFSLTLLAGLSTGIGSLLSLITNKTNTKFLSVALGFSAGVMIYVSFVEIYPQALQLISSALGDKPGAWVTTGGFFCGFALIALIDKLIPSVENPHEVHTVEEMSACRTKRPPSLMHVGILTALAIAAHNFPEGIATFTAALSDPHLGIAIAIAIAIHNIPEGIAVAVPIYCATGNRKKAFRLSFASGLAEPLGAAIGFLVLTPFMNDAVFGFVFAMTAGIMVFISLDELLPSAREYGEHHLSIYGLVAGMAVMALSLLLLE